MKRCRLAALAVFLLAGVPIAAQTEKEAKQSSETKGPEEREANPIWAWLNFLLLAGGLGYLAKKNAGPYFSRRSREIRQGMIEADEARAAAEAKAADVDRRLARLGADIEELRAEAAREQEAEMQRAGQEATREIAKIQQHLADEIAAAGKAARLELRHHAAELALELAEKKIAARMSPEIEDGLVRGFAAHLEQSASQPRFN